MQDPVQRDLSAISCAVLHWRQSNKQNLLSKHTQAQHHRTLSWHMFEEQTPLYLYCEEKIENNPVKFMKEYI